MSVLNRKYTRLYRPQPLLAFALLSFPLFYFVYKFADPEPLAHDFFQYYWLFKEFDPGKVIAPHNMRLVGSFFVFLMYKANLFYDTVSNFDKYAAWGFLKQVYFNAVFFNYICVCLTSLLIYKLVRKNYGNVLFSFCAGCLYLFGFGTMFFEMMPLTDAFSILLFAWILILYNEKRFLIFLPVFVLVLQREYLLLALGLLAFCDFLKWRHTFYFHVLGSTVTAFLLHYVLRKTVFYTPHLDFQSQFGYMYESLTQLRYVNGTFVLQLLLTCNLVLVYSGILILKRIRGIDIDKFALAKVGFLTVQVLILSIAGGHGNNVGRYYYMLTPLIIFQLVSELAPLLNIERLQSAERIQSTQDLFPGTPPLPS